MQETRREGLALKSAAAWLRLLIIIVIGSAADLWSKAWAQHTLEFSGRYADAQGAPTPTLPLLDLIWQANHGAVFGIGQNRVSFFIIFTFIAIALLIWLYAQSKPRSYLLQFMLALIAAGALGNLYDRLNFGYVRDFLRFNVTASWAFWGGEEGHLWPYVFNIADVWITVGVIGLAILWLSGVPVCGNECRKSKSDDAPNKDTPITKKEPKAGRRAAPSSSTGTARNES